MALRARKQTFVAVVKAHLIAKSLTREEADGWELLFRRCRTEKEQEEVAAAFHSFVDWWKGSSGGALGHLRRLKAGLDPYEEEDSPALTAARLSLKS